jgi:hypothetical protein
VPTQVNPRNVEKYFLLRKRGFNKMSAARESGLSYATARRIEDGLRTDNTDDRVQLRPARVVPAPVQLDDLRPEAREALEDFELFQRRYFGHIATPWQVEAANYVRDLLASPDKEFAVLNAPPGVGKSTLMTLDIPAWLICRNRALRGAIFSNTQNAANKYAQRLKRFLERTIPMQGDAMQIAKGLALDAVACVADDFGTFRPFQRENWSQEAFVVAQLHNMPIDEKEPTWQAFGFDSEYLGMRLDYLVVDDVVTKQSIRTLEAVEKMREQWDDVVEQRLEPGGVLVLQGQRLGSYDLYRYCADKVGYADDDDDEQTPVGKKYHHMVWKAHYDDRCQGSETHALSAPAWPVGCLLDPRRKAWRDLVPVMRGDPATFAVVYQQQDTDPANVLVKPIWVSGGTDPDTGEACIGCWDKGRDCWELPKGLAGDLVIYATVDPSAAKWWSIQCWAARCVDGVAYERYLLALERRKMMASDLLDWNQPSNEFVGLMEDWQALSTKLGIPIKKWIVERNGAQRYLLQYEHVRRWQAKWRVDIVPHDTALNKLDPERGIESLAGIWHYGQVRLPGKGNSIQHTPAAGGSGWMASIKLVDEVTHWPDHPTSDCLMAQWFGEFWLPRMVPSRKALPTFKRPSWLKETNTYAWASRFSNPARR